MALFILGFSYILTLSSIEENKARFSNLKLSRISYQKKKKTQQFTNRALLHTWSCFVQKTH